MAEALAVVDAEAEATTEVAATIEEEATAEVKALMELAESCGHLITVADAKERLSLEEDWRLWSLEEEKSELRGGCGDAASPQEKHHRLRCRAKKKKKKRR